MAGIRRKSLRFSSSWGSKPPSEARLRAQLANAQLATGPRTRAGRRRSALNRLAAKPKEIKLIWGGVEPQGHREFLRVWRDLRFLFWFVKREHWWQEPRLETYLKAAARAWQGKLEAARKGLNSSLVSRFDLDIESSLADFMFEYRLCNRKCDCWCRREFGAGGRELGKLRKGIEARMSSFHPRQLKAAPAAISPQERRKRAAAAEASRERYWPQKKSPAAVTSLDRNQSPITFEDLGLGPYQGPFGPVYHGNRDQ